MKRGVGDEHNLAVIVELDAIRAERRRQTRSGAEQRITAPRRCGAAMGPIFQMTPLKESDT